MNLAEVEQWELHIWCLVGWDMTDFNKWLDDPVPWKEYAKIHARLLDGRRELQIAFEQQRNNAEIAQCATELFLAGKNAARFIKGCEMESRQLVCSAKAKASASHPRPNGRDPFRQKVKEVLLMGKRQHHPLQQILKNWAFQAEHGENGLVLVSHAETNDYSITAEASGARREMSFRTLQDIFTEAG